MSNLIQINNVTKIIRKNTVLKDINLSLEEGKIYGFVGHNGSGKTMLFRLILGLIKPSQGEIEFSKPLKMGAIIENPGFLPNFSGLDNLKLLASINKDINTEQIYKTMECVGLDPTNKKSVKKYSLGMKQKLAIAQAIMESPDLIVLDEPTNGLDSKSVDKIRNIIKEENQKGKTIILSSHNQNDIDILCNVVFSMENGCIVKESFINN